MSLRAQKNTYTKTRILTLETKIADTSQYPALDSLCCYLSKVSHKIWKSLYIHKLPLSQVKADSIRKFEISGRHFNSIRFCLDGKAKSSEEIRKLNIENIQDRILATEAKCKKLAKEIEAGQAAIKAITKYKLRVEKWRLTKSGKKPKLAKKFKNTLLQKVIEQISENRFKIHQKKRRIGILQDKLEKLLKISHPSVAFGTKALFRKQFSLKASGYKDHQHWLKDWRESRYTQSYWIGSHEESARNLNAQFDPQNGLLKLRVPNHLEKSLGKHIELKSIFFRQKRDKSPEHCPEQCPELLYSFYNKRSRLVRGVLKEQYTPFNYRIIKRDGVYYVQVTFETTAAEIKSCKNHGAIGIDLNADHFAMVVIDRFGNYQSSRTYGFSSEDTREQKKAVWGDYIATICRLALKNKVPIFIENLDFAKKKSTLREKGGKKFNKMLSSFAYHQFRQMLESRCKREGIKIKAVNPAFTSVIGNFKFGGIKKLSSHEQAALVIARRGLGCSERPKVHGTRKGTEHILDEHDIHSFIHKRGVRHVWSFYTFLSKNNLQRIRTFKKRVNKIYFPPPEFPSGYFCSHRFFRELNLEFLNS